MTPWQALNEFATRLADEGHAVCQIHHRGQIPLADWSHDSHTATLISGAEADCVVLSDGSVHAP
jgi:hypothetical protein